MPEPRRPRFRSAFRISLRGTLIAVLALAVWLGWWINGARNQEAALAAIRAYDTSANITYDSQGETIWIGPVAYPIEGSSWWPRDIIERHLGPDYVYTVDSIAFGEGPADAGVTRRPDVLRDVLRLTRLRHLSLYFPVRDADVPLLTRLRSLTSLELSSDSPGLTDASLRTLVSMTSLERLLIRSAPITDAGLARLAALPRLKSLELGDSIPFVPRTTCSAVTGVGFAALADLPSLTELRIDLPALSGEGLARLGSLRRLKHLRIKGGAFSDDDLRPLANLTDLESLEIVGTTIDGTGFRHLSGLPKLNSVYLVGPNVADPALPHLARLPSLQSLTLYGTCVTAPGLDALRSAPRLKQLSVSPPLPIPARPAR